MKRLAAAGTVAVLLLVALARSQPPANQEGDASRSDDGAIRDALSASAEAFDAAYNAHDAEAVAALFAERAEVSDEDGTVVGREAIRAAFAEVFAESPQTAIRTVVESVRIPSPGVALEEGRTFVMRTPDGPEVERRYLVIHARRGDSWEIAGVREEPAGPALRPAEALEPLSWLVGDWIDESDDSTVETSCRWSDDGNWLLQDYVVRLAGGPEMSGTQRIGWDASRGQVRSWAFDSEGGFVEGTWTFDGERWTAQVSGVAADGAIGSGTRVLTPLGPDAYLLESFHRILDGEPLPDSEVTVVRRPPGVSDESRPTPPEDVAPPENASDDAEPSPREPIQ